MEKGVSIMEVDSKLIHGGNGEYATWTGFWTGVSVILGLGEVLGLIALGCHWIMSTLRIEGVITGGWESG